MRVKVKALINFFDVDTNEQREKDKSIWVCEKERADFLLEHKAIEILEEPKATMVEVKISQETIDSLKSNKNKKSKKK